MQKVLLVDDTVSDRTILRYNFGWYGYTALEADNGLEGLELARAQHPDLCAIPFIFYSAVYTGRDEEQLALKMGAMAFIVKPKGREEFWAELTKAMIPTAQSLFAPKSPALDHSNFIQEYSRIVALNLEERVRELEAVNRALQEKKVGLAQHYPDL